MNADIQGALNQINRSWRAFVHNGKPMTKQQVTAVLKYGLKKGYKTTAEFSDEEINEVLKQLHN